jgi:hypothetical protein
MLIEAPDSIRQEQMKMVLDKLFPQLAADLRKKMEDELKSWPISPIEMASQLTQGNVDAVRSKSVIKEGNAPTPAGGAGEKPVKNNRQGQVTKDSK